MRPPIDSKLPSVGTTIFTVMSRLAAEHGAINLSQGFPDFEPPGQLVDLVDGHMRRGGANQYAPMAGLPGLREAIAAKVATYYGCNVDPESAVTVTSGGTEALFCAIQALVHAGDEVIVLDPAYDSYEPAVTLAGGRTVHVPLAQARLQPGLGPGTRGAHAADAAADPQFSTQPDGRRAGGRRPATPWRKCCATRPPASSPTRSTSTWSTTVGGTTAC